MAELRLDEDQEFARPATAPQQSLLMRLALKTGLVQTERGAEYLLLALVGVCILITLFVAFSGGSAQAPQNLYAEGQNVLLPPGAVESY